MSSTHFPEELFLKGPPRLFSSSLFRPINHLLIFFIDSDAHAHDLLLFDDANRGDAPAQFAVCRPGVRV